MAETEMLEITQVRSAIGAQQRQRRTLRALGLRRVRHSVSQPDRPEIRGMIAKVAHLVEVRYRGETAAIGLEPGQEPKGEGNPPAGPSVPDQQVARLRDAEAAALAEAPESAEAPDAGGQRHSGVSLESLVEHPPSLTATDRPEAPKRRGTPAQEPEKSLPAHEVEDVEDPESGRDAS